MSIPTLARRERRSLCDTALSLGAGAPTLCGEWSAHELIAHLWIREHRPLAVAGMFVPGLSRLTDGAMARAIRTPFPELVEKLREPGLTPFALRPVEVLANTLEHVVHHEDLRRGSPGWEPRALSPSDLDEIWSATARMGRVLARPAGVPVQMVRSDTGERAVLRGGESAAVVTGPVVEVTLMLFGRSEVHDVELTGPEESVRRLREADLGA